MEFFINENIAGNVEGEWCGLEKMWILPKNVKHTFMHGIRGGNSFKEFKDIKCKGESPSLEEGNRP
jgi:hypothetical protein